MEEIVVLLSTYNGEKYLKQQLNSLINQTGVKVRIWARDDGSTDATKAILDEYEKKKLLKSYDGENLKPAWSFFDLMETAPEANYYAFCDQDDYWESDKLEIALNQLKKMNNHTPSLYCGRARVVDEQLQASYQKVNKTAPYHALSFASRLVVRNTPGCTYVFNRELLEEIISHKPSFIEMHDVWAFQVCNLLHGNLYYDDDVHILYRQHQNNSVGIGITIGKTEKWKRRLDRIVNNKCPRSNTAKELLRLFSDQMDPQEYKAVYLLANYKNNFVSKAKLLMSREYNMDSPKKNFKFKVSVLFGIY